MNAARRQSVCLALLGVFALQGEVYSQITANEGDGVLNAPYRGTIDSLRECSMDVGYGEVRNHVEPIASGTTIGSSANIDVWVDGTWDRSVLRMYEGVDASGVEIDLTGTSDVLPHSTSRDQDGIKRFSFKAIGTKTLAPQTFTVNFRYSISSVQVTTDTRITVVPVTGSFCDLKGESEAFLPGTPILDVAVGAARLTVPVGRTAAMIGAAYNFRDTHTGASNIETDDVLFPGTAETVYIQPVEHFDLTDDDDLGPKKMAWGTPWPGYLVGFHASNDVYGPEGTHYDTPNTSASGLYRFNSIRPLRQADFHPANLQYAYDGNNTNRVIEIRDQATPPNIITLTRAAGEVTGISTSDGRSWIISTDSAGWIASVTPVGGTGKRSFTYNAAGRVTQVKDDGDQVMYEFVYANDVNGMPTILTEERRRVDGTLRLVVQHEVVGEGRQRRKEYVDAGEFRQFDFIYDAGSNLKHRLASVISHGEVNRTGVPFTDEEGTPYETTYTHDVDNPAGSMVITQVDLPDESTIAYEYDKHIGTQSVDFGFRTKSTRIGPDSGSLVTYDVDYEFFYQAGTTRLFYRPRIVKQRDGRHNVPPANLNTEITFDYDDGGEFIALSEGDTKGEHLNRLLSITGPVINAGPSGQRTPRTQFIYDEDDFVVFPSFRLLRRETEYQPGMFRTAQYEYDPLSRIATETVGASGENIVTQYLYCDENPTQDRITVDADGYWTRTQYYIDGRTKVTEHFLNPNAGNLSTPCAEPTGPVYRTTNQYDSDGRLQFQIVENRDQDGVTLPPPHSATITTSFEYDAIGRLTLRTVDPDDIGQRSNYDYNWLGEIERQFDTSGRGTKRTYDGRGLVESETPLAVDEVPDANVTTAFTYDAMGNLLSRTRPTGAVEEREYDGFDRLKQIKRIPGLDGGLMFATTYEYDAANHVTRTLVEEDPEGPFAAVLSDAKAEFDEGGFNYESRQRTVAGTNNSTDSVTQRKFDWAGNVIEEKSIGDSTVADRVITTEYDDANRVRKITNNLGGETVFTRDDRGNVLNRTVKIDATNSAVTTTVYDALSRAIEITSPEDADGGRPDRIRRYDSRGNLLRETIRDAADGPKLTTVLGYDNAGRQTRQAVLANAASATLASSASVTMDRVTDSEYDADGRLRFSRTYNNNSATPRETIIGYDGIGRVDRVTDPSGGYTDEDYADNGRLSRREVFDGAGTRAYTFGYDGHDRIIRETALGSPDLVTMFTLDGLDRQTRITDPNGIATRTDFDLLGRRELLVEDEVGALERQTGFAYNRLSQLITQTAQNKSSTGAPLADQTTTYRYDSLGRPIRIVYPDAPTEQQSNPLACTDCVWQTFDLAGRMTQRQDQRGVITDLEYDDRGFLRTRTAGADRDTFRYDAVGRITLADRGTTVNQDSVSHSAMAYTGLGDLDSETQVIGNGGTPRITDYSYDQVGNRRQLTYPGGDVLTYTPNALNQVETVDLNAARLVDYVYLGRVLDKRRTTTTAPGGNTVYEHAVVPDSHRRVHEIANSFQPDGGDPQTIALYRFSYDNNGNPLTQTAVEGAPGFVADDRVYTVDRLNRLTATEYFENGQVESTVLDRVGNRESHTDRAGTATTYGAVNAANEYTTIGGNAVTYDAAGNFGTDQSGRQYVYDEFNRLEQIKNSTNVVLANYTYDALGRRIMYEDAVAGTTIRYYYDGRSAIEERDAGDIRLRYHIHGAQFIDEHVATFDQGTGQFTYYLPNANYSVAGTGNADGSIIDQLNYSATGDFAAGPPTPPGFYHDADVDTDIDLLDLASFQRCFGQPGISGCLAAHDRDTADVSDGDIDLLDWARMADCPNGPYLTPGLTCGRPEEALGPLATGTFAMHGRPIDVLSGGFVLQDFRARHYVPQLGRWLQRDRLGFVDGPSLYESFRGNATRFIDPRGEQIQEIINLFLTGRFLANEEIDLALSRGDVTLVQARSILLSDVGNAVAALGDAQALVLVPQGFEEGFRQPAIEATTERFEAFIFSQIEAGATLEEASSNVQLVALFGGDITGVTALGESVFGVELTTNDALTGSARVLRGVQGGSQVVLIVAGPQALRRAQARTAAARVGALGTASETVSVARASTGLTSSEGIPLRVLNAEFTPRPQIAQAIIQHVTTQEAAKLAADLSRARIVLSEAELRAARLRPDVARLSYGKAVERLVAGHIRGEPLLRAGFDPAGIGSRGPDILGIGPFKGLPFDITTSSPRAIAQHLARPYGQNLILITYDRPTAFTVFPP